ncbi:MAG: glycosyltransferase [Parvularculaceae bacterium]|nr:glycosyltransferase [Parvularculaceae bacterium]
MSGIFVVASLVVSGASLLLASYYALVVAAGVFLRKRAPSAPPGPIAVLVPAHDEESMIAATVEALRGQLREGDRLVVVADNCGDGTAAAAAKAGAEVVERRDATRRGKGYALQFGLDALRADPPEIVCIVDADCLACPGAIVAVAGAAARTQRPAQALYLMGAPAGSSARFAVSAFAWLLMNRVRMAGLYALFDSARLNGTGMAIPWKLLASRNLASGEIVEDLVLGLDLAEAGAAPVFCVDAVVRSEFPSTDEAAARQRARWEHGSLRVAIRRAPRLVVRGLLTGDLRLAALAADCLIPPLALFAAALVGSALLALCAAAIGAGASLLLAVAAFALFGAATALAWFVHGRDALPPRELPRVVSYLLGKVKVYGRDARQSTKTWTRTDRGGAPR